MSVSSLDANSVKLTFDKAMELARNAEKKNKTPPIPRPYKDPNMSILQWELRQMSKADQQSYIRQTFITGQNHCSKKTLDELKQITLNEMMLPKVHFGHYLLCRTVTSSDCFVCVGAQIQDTNGDVENLALYNFQLDLLDDPNKLLPKGTIMIIKEPYLKYGSVGAGAAIRCDSPSDVLFLNETDDRLKTLAPKWMAEDTYSSFTYEMLKKKGNDSYVRRDYNEAIKYYDLALKIEPNNATIFLNKSAVYLQLNRFAEAYAEAKRARDAKSNDTDSVKILFRMGKAAYGMRDWNLALEHFVALSNLYPDNEFVPDELKKTKARIEESLTGIYDLKFLYDQYVLNDTHFFDVADYVGPVKVLDIKGKGKGLIATKDVEKGTLLLASKAFSYTVNSGSLKKIILFSANLITNKADVQTQVVNLTKTIHVLKENPNRADELYSVYAGHLNRDEVIPYGIIDTGRIEQICSISSFKPENVFSEVFHETSLEGYFDSATGLWILPSFVNHSCLENCFRVFYGDVMMLYATKNIKMGEEVTISYVPQLYPYERRQKDLEKFKFMCDCKLCQLDRADRFYEQRGNLFKEFEKVDDLVSKNPKQALKNCSLLVNKIRKTYKDDKRNNLKLQLVLPLRLLADLFKVNSEMLKASHCYTEVLELLGDLKFTMFPHIHFKIAECLMATSSANDAREFIKEAFSENGAQRGINSFELFKHIYANDLKKANIYNLI